MDYSRILSACDHTLLKQDAKWEDIRQVCDDAIKYKTASICIPPCYIRPARDYMRDAMRICTVIGFPNGNMTTKVKAFEAEDALNEGADEIDMVINIGMLKDGLEGYILTEIEEVRKACGEHILKVIVETCMLSDEEKIKVCGLVTEAGADYIKTSTGFGGGGANFEDVALFKKHVGENVKIKASGGISTLEDAERFLELGASRLGTSRVVKLIKQMRIVN